jgi:hypothetical protein
MARNLACGRPVIQGGGSSIEAPDGGKFAEAGRFDIFRYLGSPSAYNYD